MRNFIWFLLALRKETHYCQPWFYILQYSFSLCWNGNMAFYVYTRYLLSYLPLDYCPIIPKLETSFIYSDYQRGKPKWGVFILKSVALKIFHKPIMFNDKLLIFTLKWSTLLLASRRKGGEMQLADLDFKFLEIWDRMRKLVCNSAWRGTWSYMYLRTGL